MLILIPAPMPCRPDSSNGLTEAINDRLKHLRDTALCFHNLAHYIIRSLLETEEPGTELPLNYEAPIILMIQ